MENVKLVCPYCGCRNVIMTAASTEETAEDMDMGCLGIYFSRYVDGSLMLYTEREFAAAGTEFRWVRFTKSLRITVHKEMAGVRIEKIRTPFFVNWIIR